MNSIHTYIRMSVGYAIHWTEPLTGHGTFKNDSANYNIERIHALTVNDEACEVMLAHHSVGSSIRLYTTAKL